MNKKLTSKQVWEKNNVEKRKYIRSKSATKYFILEKATEPDIQLVKQWLEEREDNNEN